MRDTATLIGIGVHRSAHPAGHEETAQEPHGVPASWAGDEPAAKNNRKFEHVVLREAGQRVDATLSAFFTSLPRRSVKSQ